MIHTTHVLHVFYVALTQAHPIYIVYSVGAPHEFHHAPHLFLDVYILNMHYSAHYDTSCFV